MVLQKYPVETRHTCTGNSSFTPHLASDVTTTAIVAAMQVRETMKIISGHPELCITNVTYYDGTLCDIFTVEADIDPTCPNHGRES